MNFSEKPWYDLPPSRIDRASNTWGSRILTWQLRIIAACMRAVATPSYTLLQRQLDFTLRVCFSYRRYRQCPSYPIVADTPYIHLACSHQYAAWTVQAHLPPLRPFPGRPRSAFYALRFDEPQFEHYQNVDTTLVDTGDSIIDYDCSVRPQLISGSRPRRCSRLVNCLRDVGDRRLLTRECLGGSPEEACRAWSGIDCAGCHRDEIDCSFGRYHSSCCRLRLQAGLLAASDSQV